MKKSYIAAIALVGLALASCGSRKQEPVDAEMVPIEEAMLEDSLEAATDTVAIIDEAFEVLDTKNPKDLEAGVKDIKNKIVTLYKEGDEAMASKYLERLQEWYKTNKAEVKKIMKDSKAIDNLIKSAKEAKTKFAEKAEELKDKAQETADELKEEYGDEIEDVKEKAKAKAEEVKEKHADDVKAATTKAKEAAGTAKTKAKEAASKVSESVKK